MQESKHIFSIRLKALRIAKGMTQKQLAKALNVSVSSISKWENIKVKK